MRLCNADVDEAERNPSQFEDFDEPEDDEGLRLQGCGKELLKVDRLGSADRGLQIIRFKFQTYQMFKRFHRKLSCVCDLPRAAVLGCHCVIAHPRRIDLSGSSKSFFDLRQRTLSGMDLMPAFRVVVLSLARKLKNNTKDPPRQTDQSCGRN